MDTKHISKLILNYLGTDFCYYDAFADFNDKHKNEIYLHFKFNPSNTLQKDEIKHMFETKLNGLKLLFPEDKIIGGYALWFGYIITVQLNTFKYELETIKSLCGV